MNSRIDFNDVDIMESDKPNLLIFSIGDTNYAAFVINNGSDVHIIGHGEYDVRSLPIKEVSSDNNMVDIRLKNITVDDIYTLYGSYRVVFYNPGMDMSKMSVGNINVEKLIVKDS